MRMRLCIPFLLGLTAVVAWTATARAQPPGGPPRGGFTFDRVLERHDKNDDGKVTREEWQGPEEIFTRMDEDKDGVITKKEFESRMQGGGGFGPGRGRPGGSGTAKKIEGPSIVKGKPAGLDVGQYPPDFQLQPIEAYPKFREWLGDAAPKSADDKVKLSQLVGKQPILLLYGSYT
ncbi:MAG: EF-hand domain-containing protein [Candidatus Nealsonbacteria bacterium]|nr:EF-hand domain-containing protein [Candidatus Nealsonbacteria bacterium]